MSPKAEDIEPAEVRIVRDDRLQLIFTCCHPALSPDRQMALTLRLLGGMSTPEVADAFLVSGPTMAQRLGGSLPPMVLGQFGSAEIDSDD
jgi:predicted RNA polymerase sigma factor